MRGERRLAATGLADDAQRLTALDRKADSVDGTDYAFAAARCEVLGELIDTQQLGHDTGFQQAASWPGTTVSSGGIAARH